ncbi:hypothetical protein H0266_18570 [Halobacillus locisalis]|uniref:Uncharacterized protein n=1 Tax=Halobacillus locisalis TaxID=220753 RepID=A0A838CYD0_9BACI|nr:hypothetical protein [Halobacillus locisalis]MBA2176888.1 hypothetical protein [Halobacillus locisalis]
MGFFKTLIGVIVLLAFVLIFGRVLMDQFPQLRPVWDEVALNLENAYNWISLEYGAMMSFAIVGGIVFLVFAKR